MPVFAGKFSILDVPVTAIITSDLCYHREL